MAEGVGAEQDSEYSRRRRPPLSPQDSVHDVTVNVGGAGEHTVRVDASERRSSRPEIPPPLPPNLPPPAPPKGYEDDEWPDSNTVVPPPPGYEGAVNGDRDHTVQDTSKPQWRSSTLPVGGAPPRQGDVDRYATTERPVSSVSLESSVEGDKKKHKSVFRGWFHRKSKDKDGKGDQMSDLKADRV
ncbi:PREDICTED: formin-like protein 20 isoform X1 [Priapulus caudatus]|uniref:Formin-like protein 20 isoform X1 n=1 Tax=Priapulus caudatus TaxID=37621 RepID=A0ABM1E8N4_PRICU|nr:PREDICTED: formin-like protein 20 isoform X1 [Priapulus caudatus]